jgi:uncharacterized protein YecE (DUF72 family)
MTVYIGTSGWQYSHWRNRFYPAEVSHQDWLPYFADRFQVVEVNNTFYNLPAPAVFARWREQTPDDFIFALKMSRYLTHLKRLRDPREPVERFLKAALELGDKMGPVLLQLPPRMKVNLEGLGATLEAFPEKVRVAVEFRDDTWFIDEVRELLTRHKAAVCLADRNEKLLTPEWRTAGWGYARFHWGGGQPESSYSESALRSWVSRIRRVWHDSDDVFVFFNNDAQGSALLDASRLGKMLAAQRLNVTRLPARDDIHIHAA